MSGFVLRRVVAGVITLFVVATLSFFITRLSPGSPFQGDKELSDETIAALEEYYGLDRPIMEQYARTMLAYAQGDFGPSYYHQGTTVGKLISSSFGVSLKLGALAFIFALGLGVPLGVYAAARQNKAPDHIAMSVSILGICVPNFLLGPLLIMFFGFVWYVLPVGRWPDSLEWSELKRLILPTITLGLVHVAYVSRLMRAGMLEVLRTDYIRTARAKGATPISVVLRHGLKNGITPVLSYAGPMAAGIITGSVVVEKVFDIPGLGQHFVKSALARDHPLLMGSVLVFSMLIILFNLLVDVAYSWLDPRVRAR